MQVVANPAAVAVRRGQHVPTEKRQTVNSKWRAEHVLTPLPFTPIHGDRVIYAGKLWRVDLDRNVLVSLQRLPTIVMPAAGVTCL